MDPEYGLVLTVVSTEIIARPPHSLEHGGTIRCGSESAHAQALRSAIFAFVDDLVGHDEARYRGVEECRMPWLRVLLSAERTLEGIGRGRGFTRLTFRGPGYIRGQRHA